VVRFLVSEVTLYDLAASAASAASASFAYDQRERVSQLGARRAYLPGLSVPRRAYDDRRRVGWLAVRFSVFITSVFWDRPRVVHHRVCLSIRISKKGLVNSAYEPQRTSQHRLRSDEGSDAQGTPTQSHISPSILVYQDKAMVKQKCQRPALRAAFFKKKAALW